MNFHVCICEFSILLHIALHTFYRINLDVYFRSKVITYDRAPTTQQWNHFNIVILFLSNVLLHFMF